MKKDKPLGIAKRNIKKGETIIEINLSTGSVYSDCIQFFPGVKKELRKQFCYSIILPKDDGLAQA